MIMRTVILCFVSLIIQKESFSQVNSDAYINNYNEPSSYFDSVHNSLSTQLNCLNTSFYCHIAFRVDTNGMTTDLEIIEVPVAKLPDMVKTYIKALIRSSDGKWAPQVKDSRKVISDDKIFLFTLGKKEQGMEEKLREGTKIADYFLTGGKVHEKIIQFSHTTNKHYLTLRY
jgi:hypothetical protein